MKRLPKRPRTFGRTKYKVHKKKQKRQSRFSNAKISKIFDEMINIPAYWYYIKYDEHGQYSSVGVDFDGTRKEQLT
jgi:hypothetical protein